MADKQEAQRQAAIAMARLQRLSQKRRELQAIKSPVGARERKRQIAALEEGARNILNTAIVTLGMTQTSPVVDENNYKTYDSKVNGAYSMFEQTCRYGGELFSGCVETRAAFIGGEGVSIVTKNKAAEKFLNEFIKNNELNGSRLMDFIITSELEGKCLLTLSTQKKDTGLAKDEDTKFVAVDSVRWIKRRYRIKRKGDRLESITYRESSADAQEKTYNLKETVLIQTGRAEWNNDDATPSKLHKALTNFENFSRGVYDLRRNTHLFAKVVPVFKTQNKQDADIIAQLMGDDWDIGDGYAGPGDPSLLEPTGSAAKALLEDVVLNLKVASHVSGIPIHWLAWPELMSNRATAENLMEVVNSATKKERLIWESGLRELFLKACIYATNKVGTLDAGVYPDDLVVHLPFVSLALLKLIVEVWQPLKDDGTISPQTFTALLPGNIQYEAEQAVIKKNKEKAAKDSPLKNGALEEALKNIRQGAGNGQEAGSGAMPDLDGNAGAGGRAPDGGTQPEDH